MNFHFPQRNAVCIAENANHSLYNLLTPRGALVRDARAWSRYLDEAVVIFAPQTEVLIGSHTWPTWGNDKIVTLLSEQRDLYGYLHDQTLRMMNQGLTGIEIAEAFVLPSALQKAWHTPGFYGSVSFNVKAIYQRYMGWFDGNPVHLWEHPPVQAAKRYVSCMGGVNQVVSKAQEFTRDGDLRFAATLLIHAIFAESSHSDAKRTLVSVYKRLAYGAEYGSWRNCYLMGALELQTKPREPLFDDANVGVMSALSVERLLDTIALRVDGTRAQVDSFTIELHLKDLNEQYRIVLSNGVLLHSKVLPGRAPNETANFGCELTHRQLLQMLGKASIPEGVKHWGEPAVFDKLFSFLEAPNPAFPIVTP